MKKVLTSVLFLFLCLLSSFALQPYMRQNDRCTVVDLGSNAFLSHLTNSSFTGNNTTDATNLRDTGKYYWPQNLAVIGITEVRHKVNNQYEAYGDITIKAELVSSEWCYTLIGNEDYKRPFGIDFFCRGKNGSSDLDISNYSWHMGNQPHSSSGTDTITVPASVVKNYDAIWWDCALVMDLPVDTVNDQVEYGGTIYHLLPTDEYYTATVRFTISCSNGAEQQYDLHLAGTYKPNHKPDSSMTSIMSISRLPAATSIDIAQLYETRQQTDIATYGYTTNSVKNGNSDGLVYLYLSSSPSGQTTSGASISKFTLRFTNPNTGAISEIDSSSNSINFIAYLNSERGYKYSDGPGTTGVSITYDGTDGWMKDTPILRTNYLVLPGETTYDKQPDKYVRWFDSGTISIAIPQASEQTFNNTPENLAGGMYTGNIYIHVVTYI
ncbi:MAG: hypothetical protein IJ663_07270 [Spirochaetales bacterium]|nr:hypothetical protein [Spirochaetales bacterium]